ncbi:WD40-repeat-containing domain protein, partial [Hygrophoropsis aurantiaca]
MEVDMSHELQLVADLQGHDERAWQIAWNPAEPLLASCSADKSVRLYNYQGSNESLKFSHIHTIPTGHTKTVRSIAWSPSGKTLATGSFDSNVGIWEREGGHDGDEEAADWECMTLLEGHETECKSVGYSSSGTLLASCSRDKTVWVWEVHPDSDFECMGVLMEHTQDVKCVAWHPTEEILASASYDDTIKLYLDDPSEDWFCFSTLTGHKATVWSLSWSPRGSYLASSSDDLTIKIWKRVAEHKWECVLDLKGHDRSIYSISWGKGKASGTSLGWIASTGGDGKINVWDISEVSDSPNLSHKLISTLPAAHDISDVNSISWCPREGFEDLLATAGDDGSVKVWKVVPT